MRLCSESRKKTPALTAILDTLLLAGTFLAGDAAMAGKAVWHVNTLPLPPLNSCAMAMGKHPTLCACVQLDAAVLGRTRLQQACAHVIKCSQIQEKTH